MPCRFRKSNFDGGNITKVLKVVGLVGYFAKIDEKIRENVDRCGGEILYLTIICFFDTICERNMYVIILITH